MIVTPPVERPFESAGYLGYYTRTHLTETFDLVDIDGTNPVVWLYRKSATQIMRLIEEKPFDQSIHPSQERVFRHLIRSTPLRVYVIQEAHRLVGPDFPVSIVRLGRHPYHDQERKFDRDAFDSWLTDGLDSDFRGPVRAEPKRSPISTDTCLFCWRPELEVVSIVHDGAVVWCRSCETEYVADDQGGVVR